MSGICAIRGEDAAKNALYCMMTGTQHRGQDGVGIGALVNGKLYTDSRQGLITQAFDEESISGFFPASVALGHNRYPVRKGISIQPVPIMRGDKVIALLALDGNLINSEDLKNRYPIGNLTCDAKIIARLIEIEIERYNDFEEALNSAIELLIGAFALVILEKDGTLYAIRDPRGFRPLVIGEFNGNGHGYIVASETTAFVPLENIDDQSTWVKPIFLDRGTIAKISQDGISYKILSDKSNARPSLCLFEFVYIGLPTSNLWHEGIVQEIGRFRCRQGMLLAERFPIDADYVSCMPETGRPAAEGYGIARPMPCISVFSNHARVRKTFMQPTGRVQAADRKHIVIEHFVDGKRVIIIDDSIVRGSTLLRRIKSLKNHGVKEVHLLICSPPFRYPCCYGVDTAHHNELVASHRSVDEIREMIGADSLSYISLKEAIACTDLGQENFCTACFTGEYPTGKPDCLI